jgi:heavy metal sensor kinase
VNFSIRTRLTIWYVALLAAILAALGVFLLVRLKADLVAGVDRSLGARAAQISLGLQGSGEGEFQDVSDAALAGLPQTEYASQLLSANGTVMESSGDTIAEGPMLARTALERVLRGEPVRQTVALGVDGERFRVLALPAPKQPGREVLVVAISLEDVDESVHRLLLLLFIAGPAALAAAGAGGWWLARKALRPVARLTDQAGKIGIDRLHERVTVPKVTDELGQLAQTFNAMLERLEQGVEDKRRFVADASHELRTPLAVMRSELDVTLDADRPLYEAREVLESARVEVERMSRIVENLLTLARIDEGKLRLFRTPIHLRELIETVVRELQPLANAKAIHVEIAGERAEVSADRERLGLAVTTLVENALKYSTSGGEVRISVWQRADEAGITVTDNGPGIPRDELPRIFDRFFRVDPARSRSEGGSGLGLAICREIVEAHGGRVCAESEEGTGSAFSLSLEALAPEHETLIPASSARR